MSIKSDKWIKRVAVKHQMIVPFEEGCQTSVPCGVSEC